MSMSVSFHANRGVFSQGRELKVSHRMHNEYVTLHLRTSNENVNQGEIDLFVDYEQAKQLHKELTKVMKEIAARDKRTKVEIHKNNVVNSKAQKFSQLALTDDLPF